ncbi:hypothetical protein Thermo_00304 [Thermoplasmatales archaeon]|nr:hypothetical protein Thermo_00304 [Thermoplasmatales archaeon]
MFYKTLLFSRYFTKSSFHTLHRNNSPLLGEYSKSISSIRVNPSSLHIAFDASLFTEGWVKIGSRFNFANWPISILTAAVAIPFPWNSGITNRPVSHPFSPFHSVSQFPVWSSKMITICIHSMYGINHESEIEHYDESVKSHQHTQFFISCRYLFSGSFSA